MTKIMFVCHGNICRSPMAEFIMKDLVLKKGLENEFYIESSATSTEEIGNPVYPPARRILEKRGIDCLKKRARQITKQDGQEFDYLICMDSKNLGNLKRIINPQDFNKVHKLLDFTNNPRDVADPWYTGNFDITEKDVENGCEALLKFIVKK